MRVQDGVGVVRVSIRIILKFENLWLAVSNWESSTHSLLLWIGFYDVFGSLLFDHAVTITLIIFQELALYGSDWLVRGLSPFSWALGWIIEWLWILLVEGLAILYAAAIQDLVSMERGRLPSADCLFFELFLEVLRFVRTSCAAINTLSHIYSVFTVRY